MKKPKHELMTFVAGIVMLVAGLFITESNRIVQFLFFIWRDVHLGSKNQFRNGSDSFDHRNCLDVYDRFLCIKGFFGTCRTVDRHHGYSDNEYTFDDHDFI